MSKHSSAPISEFFSKPLTRARRSLRRRSIVDALLPNRLPIAHTCSEFHIQLLLSDDQFVAHKRFGHLYHAPSAFGTVRSSSAGENGTGTSIAPMRFTGASR